MPVTGPLETRTIETDMPTDKQAPKMYESAVYLLGMIALASVVGAAVLIGLGHDVDAGLIALGASAVGGLVSMLAPRKTQ